MKVKQFGRSMIEMLGVLAIIGVLSIGGILGYRRAVNNHQANTILDDVNRFAFVILERSGLALGDVVSKGDFKENGIYTLEGYQDTEPNLFSITVKNVPKGVCEPLLDKATIEYKVRVNPNANEKGKLYDTLNKDLCTNDTNIMVFYFGDTTDLCNPKENGYTPCTINSDCCGGEFCAYINATDADKLANGNGRCEMIQPSNLQEAVLSDGQHWVRSLGTMNGWTVFNFCAALGLRMTNSAELKCSGYGATSTCENSSVISDLKQIWGDKGYHCIDDGINTFLKDGIEVNAMHDVDIADWGRSAINGVYLGSGKCFALCH